MTGVGGRLLLFMYLFILFQIFILCVSSSVFLLFILASDFVVVLPDFILCLLLPKCFLKTFGYSMSLLGLQ